jgi:glycosyltransferase involved in cell wall biosynthesis
MLSRSPAVPDPSVTDPSGRGPADETPDVTVVIPTVGRATLTAAVASALEQADVDVEVVVAASGDARLASEIGPLLPPGVRVVHTDGRGSANVARNAGIRVARGRYVALLDDDDRWAPDKLGKQVRALEGATRPSETICATAYGLEGRFQGEVWPVRPPRPEERMADYLFRRSSLRRRPVGFQTSTILAPRAVFAACAFDEDLPIHQDWDWLIRATDRHGYDLAFVDEPLSVYRYGGDGSTTSRTRWQQSRDWALGAPMSRRARGDFLLTVSMTFASSQGSVADVASLLRTAYTAGSPGVCASLLVVPRIARGLLRRVAVALRERGAR